MGLKLTQHHSNSRIISIIPEENIRCKWHCGRPMDPFSCNILCITHITNHLENASFTDIP